MSFLPFYMELTSKPPFYCCSGQSRSSNSRFELAPSRLSFSSIIIRSPSSPLSSTAPTHEFFLYLLSFHCFFLYPSTSHSLLLNNEHHHQPPARRLQRRKSKGRAKPQCSPTPSNSNKPPAPPAPLAGYDRILPSSSSRGRDGRAVCKFWRGMRMLRHRLGIMAGAGGGFLGVWCWGYG